MKIAEIATKPTVVTHEMMKQARGAIGVHESNLRSWYVLGKVKELLAMETPAPVILEMIEVMEPSPKISD